MTILTAIMAVMYLHERWQKFHTLGALLILLGVILAQIKAKKVKKRAWLKVTFFQPNGTQSNATQLTPT